MTEQTAPENQPSQGETQPVSQIGPRVMSFFEEIIQGSPEGKNLMMALEAVVAATVNAGFPDEKARRCVSLWLIDVGWTHLARATSLMQENFLGITTKPKAMPPMQEVPASNEVQPPPAATPPEGSKPEGVA